MGWNNVSVPDVRLHLDDWIWAILSTAPHSRALAYPEAAHHTSARPVAVTDGGLRHPMREKDGSGNCKQHDIHYSNFLPASPFLSIEGCSRAQG
jgi:hypothetical protein